MKTFLSLLLLLILGMQGLSADEMQFQTSAMGEAPEVEFFSKAEHDVVSGFNSSSEVREEKATLPSEEVAKEVKKVGISDEFLVKGEKIVGFLAAALGTFFFGKEFCPWVAEEGAESLVTRSTTGNLNVLQGVNESSSSHLGMLGNTMGGILNKVSASFTTSHPSTFSPASVTVHPELSRSHQNGFSTSIAEYSEKRRSPLEKEALDKLYHSLKRMIEQHPGSLSEKESSASLYLNNVYHQAHNLMSKEPVKNRYTQKDLDWIIRENQDFINSEQNSFFQVVFKEAINLAQDAINQARLEYEVENDFLAKLHAKAALALLKAVFDEFRTECCTV